ncbi:MAG TPA: pyridoxal phosphate-dependent aminotransferase [Candidatus Limnocylindria bacterium]|nr:pyridoxal phosphate-dependent aminotransferase [Candidatus Limnocylindria bacterium]
MFSDRTNWNLDANRLSRALMDYRAAGKPLLDLTASNPTECGFEYDQQAILRALANPAVLHYEPNPKGLLTARQAVAAHYRSRGDIVSADDLILTASTSEAYSFIFRTLCNPADEILIPGPSYPLLSFLADIEDVKLVRYPLIYDHGWQIDLHALEQATTSRTRGVIVVNPNNPTGHFCSREDAAKLNQICSVHNMAIIADEVFLDFALNSGQQHSFASNSGALTLTMSGLSKISGLPQMKAAWLLTTGPAELKTQALSRLEVIADTFLTMNAPVQLATPAFLEMRRSFQGQLIARVRANLAELDHQMAGQKSCGRLELEGGWYAVLRVPATSEDEDLAIELLTAKGVYVHPGHFYDFPADGYLVVSLITLEKDFAEGIKLLLSMF